MELVLFLIIFGIIGAVVGLWPLYRNDYKQIWRALDGECAMPKSQAKFRFWDRFKWTRQRTPEGAGVIAPIKIPAKALQNLDIGLKNMLAQHKFKWPSWAEMNDIKKYTFVFVEKNLTNIETDPGSPAIYRQGFQTAGTTLGLSPYPSVHFPCIVLPLQDYCEWSHNDYLMRSAWNEGEHVHEWYNDLTEFYLHANVSDVHPHAFDESVPVMPAV